MDLLGDPKVQNPAKNSLLFPYRRTGFALCQVPHTRLSLLARKRQVFRLASKDTVQGVQGQWQDVKIRRVWLEECKADHYYERIYSRKKKLEAKRPTVEASGVP